MPPNVTFQFGRARSPGVPEIHGGARILFFTGVRYCREEGAPPPSGRPSALLIRLSDRPLGAAAH